MSETTPHAADASSDDARARRYYDDFSRNYDHGRDAGYHALVDDIEAGIVLPHARGRRALEVGCGTGLLLERVAGQAREAIGIDVSPGMLRAAQARGLNVLRASATALPFADDSFDVTYSFKVLAHVPQLDRALREMARVTRPGGVLVIELYNPWSLRYAARRLAGARRIGASHREDDVSTQWHSPPRLRRAIPAGCELVELRGVRVVTPFAALHRVPLMREALAWAERRASRSALARFGGFLVAIARKRGGALSP